MGYEIGSVAIAQELLFGFGTSVKKWAAESADVAFEDLPQLCPIRLTLRKLVAVDDPVAHGGYSMNGCQSITGSFVLQGGQQATNIQIEAN